MSEEHQHSQAILCELDDLARFETRLPPVTVRSVCCQAIRKYLVKNVLSYQRPFHHKASHAKPLLGYSKKHHLPNSTLLASPNEQPSTPRSHSPSSTSLSLVESTLIIVGPHIISITQPLHHRIALSHTHITIHADAHVRTRGGRHITNIHLSFIASRHRHS